MCLVLCPRTGRTNGGADDDGDWIASLGVGGYRKAGHGLRTASEARGNHGAHGAPTGRVWRGDGGGNKTNIFFSPLIPVRNSLELNSRLLAPCRNLGRYLRRYVQFLLHRVSRRTRAFLSPVFGWKQQVLGHLMRGKEKEDPSGKASSVWQTLSSATGKRRRPTIERS